MLHLISIALRKGIISKDAVIKWADEIIKTEEDLPSVLFDLSLCQTKTLNDMLSVISENIVYDENIPVIPPRAFLGVVYHQLVSNEIDSAKAAMAIYDLVNQKGGVSNYEKTLIYRIDHHYEYFINSLESDEEYKKLLFDFLLLYKDLTQHNFADWDSINISVANAIEKLEAEEIANLPKGEEPFWKFWKDEN